MEFTLDAALDLRYSLSTSFSDLESLIIPVLGILILVSKKYRALWFFSLYAAFVHLLKPVMIGIKNSQYYSVDGIHVLKVAALNGESVFRHLEWACYLFFTHALPACLLLALVWQAARRLTGRNIWLPFVFIVMIFIILPYDSNVLSGHWLPVLQMPFLLRINIPFFLVNLAIVLAPRVFLKTHEPFLIVWYISAQLALLVDLGKFFLSHEHFLTGALYKVMSDLEPWLGQLETFAFSLIVSWSIVPVRIKQILKDWLYLKLRNMHLVATRNLVPVSASARGENQSHYSNQVMSNNDYPARNDLNNPHDEVYREQDSGVTSGQMTSLSRKTFLNQSEIALYTGIEPDKITAFVEKFGLLKEHDCSSIDGWLVKRESIDAILDLEPDDDE